MQVRAEIAYLLQFVHDLDDFYCLFPQPNQPSLTVMMNFLKRYPQLTIFESNLPIKLANLKNYFFLILIEDRVFQNKLVNLIVRIKESSREKIIPIVKFAIEGEIITQENIDGLETIPSQHLADFFTDNLYGNIKKLNDLRITARTDLFLLKNTYPEINEFDLIEAALEGELTFIQIQYVTNFLMNPSQIFSSDNNKFSVLIKKFVENLFSNLSSDLSIKEYKARLILDFLMHDDKNNHAYHNIMYYCIYFLIHGKNLQGIPQYSTPASFFLDEVNEQTMATSAADITKYFNYFYKQANLHDKNFSLLWQQKIIAAILHQANKNYIKFLCHISDLRLEDLIWPQVVKHDWMVAIQLLNHISEIYSRNNVQKILKVATESTDGNAQHFFASLIPKARLNFAELKLLFYHVIEVPNYVAALEIIKILVESEKNNLLLHVIKNQKWKAGKLLLSHTNIIDEKQINECYFYAVIHQQQDLIAELQLKFNPRIDFDFLLKNNLYGNPFNKDQWISIIKAGLPDFIQKMQVLLRKHSLFCKINANIYTSNIAVANKLHSFLSSGAEKFNLTEMFILKHGELKFVYSKLKELNVIGKSHVWKKDLMHR